MSLCDLDNGGKTSFFGMTTYKVNKLEMWGWMHNKQRVPFEMVVWGTNDASDLQF
jgi:hypothetical protein